MELRLPKPSAGALVTFLLRWLGGLLCLVWVTPLLGWWGPTLTAMYLALARTAVPRSTPGWIARLWRIAALTIVTPLHLVWLVIAIGLGGVLSRDIAPLVVILSAGALIGTIVTWRENRWRLRIPAALPLGLWTVGCLLTWIRIDSTVQCDDLTRVPAQRGVTLAVRTLPATSRCEAGARLPIGRSPQQLRFLPDGERMLFTAGAQGEGGESRPSAFNGSVCSANLQGDTDLHCVGEGAGEFVADPEADAPLFATATGTFDGYVGVLYTLAEKPLRITDERHSTTLTTALYADRGRDTLGVFSRDSDLVLRQRMSDRLSTKVGLVFGYPSAVQYDAARHEGLLCGGGTMNPGEWGLVSVFTPEPFTFTPLHQAIWSPFAWFGGCDWTADRQTIFATVPVAGLLVSLNRAEPQKRTVRSASADARAIAVDDRRGHVYVGGVVSGEIRAIDTATGRELNRWFVGHSLHDLRLRPDGSELLAATTLGIVRVSLDVAAPQAEATR